MYIVHTYIHSTYYIHTHIFRSRRENPSYCYKVGNDDWIDKVEGWVGGEGKRFNLERSTRGAIFFFFFRSSSKGCKNDGQIDAGERERKNRLKIHYHAIMGGGGG